jgi:hypothetical protein
MLLACRPLIAGMPSGVVRFAFCGDSIIIPVNESVYVPYSETLSPASIRSFYEILNAGNWKQIVDVLLAYRDEKQLNDWVYYQLVRHTVQELAPKADNYYRYTLFKWFLMVKSGYDAALSIRNDQLLFYIYSTDDISGIPFYLKNNRQYVCLNIHDYAKAANEPPFFIRSVEVEGTGSGNPFSYKITRLPEFNVSMYDSKEISFPFKNRTYNFVIKLNPQVKSIFSNYPVVDYASYFNIPLSDETYKSLIPLLKMNLNRMKLKKGVDYLMNFTRYAFLYEDDQANFGREKRMGAEETLLSKASDCDDRAALFFFLVKEIYNLPIIAVLYPTHITVAVQFDKPIGQTIEYNGNQYSICEPTPQATHLSLGQVAPKYRQMDYKVVYAYSPH